MSGPGGGARAPKPAPFPARYDYEAARLVRRFRGHTDRITDLALAADARWLLSASLDGSLRVWDVPAAVCLQARPRPAGPMVRPVAPAHVACFCPPQRKAGRALQPSARARPAAAALALPCSRFQVPGWLPCPASPMCCTAESRPLPRVAAPIILFCLLGSPFQTGANTLVKTVLP